MGTLDTEEVLGLKAWSEDQIEVPIERIREYVARLLSEREPVGDGEVETALAHLRTITNRDRVYAPVLARVSDTLRRLARQCAEQRALLAELALEQDIAVGIFKAINEVVLPATVAVRVVEFQIRAVLQARRRNALLNQERGK